MAGTISSLGIGSGVLTADIIDKLRASDESLVLSPITEKIALQKQKSSALSLLSSLLTTFKSNVSSLDNDTLYQQRSVTGNNDSVNVIASPGVSIQDFTISDIQMATKNVQESGSFLSTDAKVSSGSGTMTITVGGLTYDIDYTSSTSLSDLKDAINAEAGDKVKASTLQVGENDYRLILTSVDTGADETISISDSAVGSLTNSLLSYKKTASQAFTAPTDTVASGAGNLSVQIGTSSYTISYDTSTTLQSLADAINTAAGATVASIDGSNRLVLTSNTAGFSSPLTLTDNSGFLDAKLTNYTTYNPLEEIQGARDATFKYNGVTVTRSSNEIDDIITGVTINLLGESGSANIAIKQNVDTISAEMQSLVESYNTLTSQLKDMTIADLDAGKVGIFSGDSSINLITREINKLITSMSDGLSLSQFGIDLNENGVMSFNASTFATKFNEDAAASEAFFSGVTSIDSNGNTSSVDGIFTSLNGLMERYTKSNGILNNLTNNSSSELKTLEENKKRSQALLDARYDAMTARFVQYDTIISKLENQFSVLQQQIQMAVNAKN